MPGYTRLIFALSVIAVALGTGLAMTGVLRDHLPVWRVGLIVLVAALPSLCYALIHRASQVSRDQLDLTYRAGYEQALRHVSMGLLDPTAPTDGGETVARDGTQGITPRGAKHLPDNVRPIRPHDDKEKDRKTG